MKKQTSKTDHTPIIHKHKAMINDQLLTANYAIYNSDCICPSNTPWTSPLTCLFIHRHLQGCTITVRMKTIFQTVKAKINFAAV
jgi:hypothetical protein